MTVTLDGLQMQDRAAAHDHLKVQLQLPDYYGRNLDALYDLLTEYGQPLEITFSNEGVLTDLLGDYGNMLMQTIRDAAESNPALTLIEE